MTCDSVINPYPGHQTKAKTTTLAFRWSAPNPRMYCGRLKPHLSVIYENNRITPLHSKLQCTMLCFAILWRFKYTVSHFQGSPVTPESGYSFSIVNLDSQTSNLHWRTSLIYTYIHAQQCAGDCQALVSGPTRTGVWVGKFDAMTSCLLRPAPLGPYAYWETVLLIYVPTSAGEIAEPAKTTFDISRKYSLQCGSKLSCLDVEGSCGCVRLKLSGLRQGRNMQTERFRQEGLFDLPENFFLS